MAHENSSQYYHFAYDPDQAPAMEPPQISTRERVAKILRETELKDVPDLIFRKPMDSKAFKQSMKENKDAKENVPLYNERELFSIDDDDNWDFEGELNIGDHPQSSQQPTKPNMPIYTPNQPIRSSALSKGSTEVNNGPVSSNRRKDAGRGFDTYIDDSAVDGDAYPASNSQAQVRSTQMNIPTLLPMSSVLDDDESPYGQGHHELAIETRDTQPIITINQADLTNSARSTNRYKFNSWVGILLIVFGLLVVICTISLIATYERKKGYEPENNSTSVEVDIEELVMDV